MNDRATRVGGRRPQLRTTDRRLRSRASGGAEAVLALQRRAGNAAVAHAIQRSGGAPSEAGGGPAPPLRDCKLTPEALRNLLNAGEGRNLIAVVPTLGECRVHVGLSRQQQPGRPIEETEKSSVGGTTRQPYPRGGGHSSLANDAGLPARQTAPGRAEGNARGATVRKEVGRISLVNCTSGLNIGSNPADPSSRDLPPSECATLFKAFEGFEHNPKSG